MSYIISSIYNCFRGILPDSQDNINNQNAPAIEEEVLVEREETVEEMAERMGAELDAFAQYEPPIADQPERQELDPDFERLALLPEFLSFSFDIHDEKACLQIDLPTYFPDTKEMIEEFGLQIIKDTAIGLALGITGGVVYGMYKCKNAWTYIGVGSKIGIALGFATGVSRSVLVHIDLTNLAPHLKDSASKSQKVIQALIDQNKNELLGQECDINCSISMEVMVYPVKTPCEHVFENIEILKWLSSHSTCPNCRREIEISELLPDEKAIKNIRNIAQTSFKNMEVLLKKLPRRRMGLSHSPALYSRAIVRSLAEKVINGKSLLQEDETTILKKIKEGTLSCEEAYTVAYYLIKQFKPMTEKIKCIYSVTRKAFQNLYDTGKIDQPTLAKYSSALDLWFTSANPITKQEFPILHSML